METYSECLGRVTTLAEDQYRASTNPIVFGGVDAVASTVHAAHAQTRLYTYDIHRLINPETATLWDTFAAGGAEDGYIHHTGTRRQLPSGGLIGYYVMNMGHAPYVAWQASRAVKLIDGTLYGHHPGLNMDAINVDLTMWYADYDAVHEEVLTSDEYKAGGTYPGEGPAYSTACVNAFSTVKTTVVAAYPAADVFPNFGDLLYISNPPALAAADTDTLLAASTTIQGQVALSYTGGEPDLTSAECEARWAAMAALSGKRLLIHGQILPAHTQAEVDRAKIGVCAWMMMGEKSGLAARFVTEYDTAVEDISTWEQNNLLQAASSGLGSALGTYSKVAGVATEGELFMREYRNGLAYLFVRKAGQVGDKTINVSCRPHRSYASDGSLVGGVRSSFSLSLGEGAIVQYARGGGGHPAEIFKPTPKMRYMMMMLDRDGKGRFLKGRR